MRWIWNLVSPFGRVGPVAYGIGMVAAGLGFCCAVTAWPEALVWSLAFCVYGFACLNANRLRTVGLSQWWHLVPTVAWASVFAVPIGLLQLFAWQTGDELNDAPGTGFLAMMIAALALMVSIGFAMALCFSRKGRV